MIVGLTGGIGSGKSVAGKYFNELGIDVIDADDISRSILDDNKKVRELFLNNFGDKFLNNNKIDRNLLRSEIFKNPDNNKAGKLIEECGYKKEKIFWSIMVKNPKSLNEKEMLVMQDCSNALLTFWFIGQTNPVSLFEQALLNPI